MPEFSIIEKAYIFRALFIILQHIAMHDEDPNELTLGNIHAKMLADDIKRVFKEYFQ